MMAVEVKICGLRDEEAVAAAVEGGADYLGVVFFPPSPRNIEPAAAAEILDGVPEGIVKVGLFVDPDDAFLYGVLQHVRLDLLQFHGKESPERLARVRLETGLPVMKACPVADLEDLDKARAYEAVADRLLFDAKPPKGATRPGGNALAFDWTLLKGATFSLPWMLAGGLDVSNIQQAVAMSGAQTVDVSSGVESAPGIKDPKLIKDFLKAVKGDAE